MPLSDKDRMSLFGNIFVEYLEVGDNIDGIREIQYDDENLALNIFWKVFNEVVQELIGLNSWISVSEADMLFRTLLPHYGITNENIWWAVFNQDPTIHMWKQQQSMDTILKDRSYLINGEKKDFDRQILIQSYISQFMVGTGEYQLSPLMERREYVYFEELKKLVYLFKENKIKCSPDELKMNIVRVFPGFSKHTYLLNMVDTYFADELHNIKGEDVHIDYEIEIVPVERPKKAETLKIKELAVKSALNQIAAEQENAVTPEITTKLIDLEMTPQAIAAYLDSFIPQILTLQELKDRAKEELSKIRKAFVSDPKKVRIFFSLLGDLVKIYAPRYNYRKKDDPQNQKIGQIYAAINSLYTSMGNDVAIISSSQEIVFKIK